MVEKGKPGSEIIIKVPTSTPAEKQRLAGDVVASLHRRGIAAAQVDFSDLEKDLRSFILKQVEQLNRAATECADADLRELLIEMANGWLRLAETQA